MTSGDMSQRWPLKVPDELTVPVIAWVTPQLKDRISISFLCLSSLVSPSIPSILRKTSDGMGVSSSAGVGHGLIGAFTLKACTAKGTEEVVPIPLLQMSSAGSGP